MTGTNKQKNFWNEEYKDPKHLALSNEPAEDLIKFTKWAQRNAEWDPFPHGGTVLDLGCGNGRNITFLCREARMKGFGYDASEEAIRQATKSAEGLPITFVKRSIAGPLDLPDASVDVILDMMSSHVLDASQRQVWKQEMLRVLKPYGWVFFKTFLLDGDMNASRMLKDYPADEPGSYIHPRIGVLEHVWTEEEIYEFFGDTFTVKKLDKSHKHIKNGIAWKRRTVSVYLEKKG